jgi:tetratricopeptide (TPR) repeat protein
MDITYFAKVGLPEHKERAFDDTLLGKAERNGKPRHDRNIAKTMSDAKTCYFRGFYLDALEQYGQVLVQDMNQTAAWVGQIRILVDLGRFDDAIYWADKASDSVEKDTMIIFAKALALARTGNIDGAKTLINVPVGKNEDEMLWLLRGEVLIRVRINFLQRILTPHKGIGRLGAFFCFVKALSPDQHDPFINQRIGLAYMLAGHHNRAFEHLNLSLKFAPDNPLTMYGLAECYRMKRDYEHALYFVKKAIAGNPNLDRAFELLEWLHGPARKVLNIFKGTAGKEIS